MKHPNKQVWFLPICLALLMSFALAAPSLAAEGAWSHYVQGTYGDFGFGIAPAPGFSFRNDLIFNNSVVGESMFGGKGYGKVSQNSTTDLMKFFYFFDAPAISGRVGFGLLVPAVFNADAKGWLKAWKFDDAGSGTGNGFADAEEETLLRQVNEWLEAHDLPAGELAYELCDAETGAPVAVFDLAWPSGLQEGLSQPVALLIDEDDKVHEAANQAGFLFFTDVEAFRRYASERIPA